MDPLIIAAAIAAGLAGFYAVMWLTDSYWLPRGAIRARASAGGPQLQDVTPLRTRRRLSTGLIFSGEQTELKLIRSGWPIRVIEYRFLRLLFAGFAAGAVFLLTDLLSVESRVVRLIFVLGSTALGSTLPVIYVNFRRARRLRMIEDQLPVALTSMSKSLQAGTGLLQALEYAAEQTPDPLGPELERAVGDLRLGGDATVVFEELNRRIGSSDLEIVVAAILIQRTVGGNLSEILNTTAATIRERQELKREVRVLTTRHRVTADIVALLPIFVFIVFFLVNPDVAGLLFTETAGQIALTFAIFMQFLGLWLMQRLARIEV